MTLAAARDEGQRALAVRPLALDAMTAPHASELAAVATALGTDLSLGLNEEEARRRLAKGRNQLPGEDRRSVLASVLEQVKSPLLLLLFGAAGVALLIGAVKDAVGISLVALLNAGLGAWQEARAEKSLRALKAMLSASAQVRRGGAVHQIAAEEVVLGDVLLLEAGVRVAADGRIAVAESLEVDESALTGESVPTAKQRDPVPEASLLGDRASMAHMNTLVTRGRGELVVTATGANTEVGRISQELALEKRPTTPLADALAVLGRRLAALATGLVVLFFTVGVLRGRPWGEMLLEAVALAAAIIPEGLPTVVTVTLALGMRRMAQQRAIVKALASVETLGSTTVICSDKTGTLTKNRMTVAELSPAGAARVRADALDLADPAVRGLLRAAALCNDAQRVSGALVGDPTETALIELAETARVDVAKARSSSPRVVEVPFEAAHRYMATLHEEGGAFVVYAKGAAESVLPLIAGEEETRARWHAEAEAMAEGGLRVLAVATKRLAHRPADTEVLRAELRELEPCGLVGLEDPVRQEALDAVEQARSAGVAVKIVTGDHPGTALAVARRLGIEGDVITGRELETLDDEGLQARVEGIAVFARVAPDHKVRIVRALQARGHVAAMTGDGVNDAPALKAANIGVAMGKGGTEVAKEAAALVLTDDDLGTLVHAVHEGRTLYDNILKFVRFQLGTSFAALLAMFTAPLFGLPTPFTALQILWVNVIMDGPPAMALGLEPARAETMRLPPRRKGASILDRARLVRTVVLGTLMGGFALYLLGSRLQAGRPLPEALTLTFTAFVLFQVTNALGARVERGSVLSRSLFTNGTLWASLIVVVALQALVVYAPAAQGLFHTVPLRLADWGVAAGLALLVLVTDDVLRLGMGLVRRAR